MPVVAGALGILAAFGPHAISGRGDGLDTWYRAYLASDLEIALRTTDHQWASHAPTLLHMTRPEIEPPPVSPVCR
jgi:hypothetical protein